MANPQRQIDPLEQVISEIFTRQAGLDLDDGMRDFVPGYSQLRLFAELLVSNPREEELQVFLDQHPQMLLSYFGGGDPSIMSCLVKPPIGTQFNADFALLRYHQDGLGIWLLELERSGVGLFTKALTPARAYQTAIGQVTSWKQWIEPNLGTFARDIVRLSKAAPLMSERGTSGSFRLRDVDFIDRIAHEYEGEYLPFVNYEIIISRWGNLRPDERTRLILTNRTAPYRTRTYDQIARQAFASPWRGY